ncbi:nitroreductase family protein [Bifidobacterium imperatoris]|uniref:Nitroreductase n=1 Tax=Bifidobacterium imperatoris TaxID=2020965 RepID=A0A2N5IRG3_9BIFI|nr:nitroreductase family protein [Bifidobacterium imperatoris]PLS24545.1 nitroreductase [Bifidobacterium imperatoris]QSY58073.1 nitroreductase family protein [Bifidobacterium imperatoris]
MDISTGHTFLKQCISTIKILRQSLLLRRDYLAQAARFDRNYSRIRPRNKNQFESRVMFLTHQLEKGLSHSDFRLGFGRKIFLQLPDMLNGLERLDNDFLHNFTYNCCMSALHEYVRRHQDAEFDISWQQSCFTRSQWERILTMPDDAGHGCIEIRKVDKERNDAIPFRQLAEHRHSIREFSDEKITADEIMEAVSLAMTTPSVCNRQPTRVHIMLDETRIASLLHIQGGVNGYPTPPALLAITADLSAFMTEYERNEGYVDGGLFSMNLLYALESLGIGACPLNTMFTSSVEKETRKLLDVPDNEIFVMYIAVGHFPESTITCKSPRYGAMQIVQIAE